jgi:hypothetical protein
MKEPIPAHYSIRQMFRRQRATRLILAGLATISVLIPTYQVSAHPARARTITVGQTADNPVRCQAGSPGAYDAVQAATTAPPRYVVPARGILTSWSTRAGADGGQLQLQVWRPAARPETYELVAASPARQLTVGTLNTFRLIPGIRVRAGDVLGFRQLSQLLGCGRLTGDPGDVWATNHAGGPPPTPGTVETLGQQANLRINISATLKVMGRPVR